MTKTSELLIAVFEGGERAAEVLDELKTRDDVRFTGDKNATAITKTIEGQLRVSTPVNTTVTTVFGAIIGGFMGMFVGAPVAGILLGGAAARLGLNDKVVSLSDEDQELQRVNALMKPNTSALIASVPREWGDEIVPVLLGYGAEIIRHEFAQEVAQALTIEESDNNEAG